MQYYLLTCRSLTHAQRVRSALERRGIFSSIIRTPKNLSGAGCTYSVKTGVSTLNHALEILEAAGIPPKAVFGYTYDGRTVEVRY